MPTPDRRHACRSTNHTSKRREIRDSGALGLYLIIQPKPTGTRSWALRYRDARGKSVKLVLGPVDLTRDAKLVRWFE